MGEQIMHLLAGEHGRKGVVIFGADLGKDRPVGLTEQLDKKHFGGGDGLADGLGLPVFFEFDEKEVVAQLGFGEGSRITSEVLVDEPELTIVSMAGAIGVVMQSQQVSKLGHGRVGMLIINGIGVVSGRGPNAWRKGGLGSPLALFGDGLGLLDARVVKVDVAGG